MDILDKIIIIIIIIGSCTLSGIISHSSAVNSMCEMHGMIRIDGRCVKLAIDTLNTEVNE